MMKMRRIMILLVLLMVHALIGSFFLPGCSVLADESFIVAYAVTEGEGTVEVSNGSSGETFPKGSDLLFTAVPGDGYRLIRWSLNKRLVSGNNTNTLKLEDLDSSILVEVAFGPVYSEPETYTVTYDANGGNGTLADPNSPYTPLPLDQVGVLENIFEKPGYIFAGWNSQPDGKGIAYLPGDSFVLAENTIFYAIYALPSPDTGRWDPTIFPVLLGLMGCWLIFKKEKKTSL